MTLTIGLFTPGIMHIHIHRCFAWSVRLEQLAHIFPPLGVWVWFEVGGPFTTPKAATGSANYDRFFSLLSLKISPSPPSPRLNVDRKTLCMNPVVSRRDAEEERLVYTYT